MVEKMKSRFHNSDGNLLIYLFTIYVLRFCCLNLLIDPFGSFTIGFKTRIYLNIVSSNISLPISNLISQLKYLYVYMFIYIYLFIYMFIYMFI